MDKDFINKLNIINNNEEDENETVKKEINIKRKEEDKVGFNFSKYYKAINEELKKYDKITFNELADIIINIVKKENDIFVFDIDNNIIRIRNNNIIYNNKILKLEKKSDKNDIESFKNDLINLIKILSEKFNTNVFESSSEYLNKLENIYLKNSNNKEEEKNIKLPFLNQDKEGTDLGGFFIKFLHNINDINFEYEEIKNKLFEKYNKRLIKEFLFQFLYIKYIKELKKEDIINVLNEDLDLNYLNEKIYFNNLKLYEKQIFYSVIPYLIIVNEEKGNYLNLKTVEETIIKNSPTYNLAKNYIDFIKEFNFKIIDKEKEEYILKNLTSFKYKILKSIVMLISIYYYFFIPSSKKEEIKKLKTKLNDESKYPIRVNEFLMILSFVYFFGNRNLQENTYEEQINKELLEKNKNIIYFDVLVKIFNDIFGNRINKKLYEIFEENIELKIMDNKDSEISEENFEEDRFEKEVYKQTIIRTIFFLRNLLTVDFKKINIEEVFNKVINKFINEKYKFRTEIEENMDENSVNIIMEKLTDEEMEELIKDIEENESMIINDISSKYFPDLIYEIELTKYNIIVKKEDIKNKKYRLKYNTSEEDLTLIYSVNDIDIKDKEKNIIGYKLRKKIEKLNKTELNLKDEMITLEDFVKQIKWLYYFTICLLLFKKGLNKNIKLLAIYDDNIDKNVIIDDYVYIKELVNSYEIFANSFKKEKRKFIFEAGISNTNYMKNKYAMKQTLKKLENQKFDIINNENYNNILYMFLFENTFRKKYSKNEKEVFSFGMFLLLLEQKYHPLKYIEIKKEENKTLLEYIIKEYNIKYIVLKTNEYIQNLNKIIDYLKGLNITIFIEEKTPLFQQIKELNEEYLNYVYIYKENNLTNSNKNEERYLIVRTEDIKKMKKNKIKEKNLFRIYGLNLVTINKIETKENIEENLSFLFLRSSKKIINTNKNENIIKTSISESLNVNFTNNKSLFSFKKRFKEYDTIVEIPLSLIFGKIVEIVSINKKGDE